MGPDGRPDGSLWRPPELDLLREFRARAAADMTPLEVAFADLSERQDARRRWLRRGAIAAAIGGLLINSQQQAEFARRQAELRAEADDAKARADAQRDHAVATQSLFLAELSERAGDRRRQRDERHPACAGSAAQGYEQARSTLRGRGGTRPLSGGIGAPRAGGPARS